MFDKVSWLLLQKLDLSCLFYFAKHTISPYIIFHPSYQCSPDIHIVVGQTLYTFWIIYSWGVSFLLPAREVLVYLGFIKKQLSINHEILHTTFFTFACARFLLSVRYTIYYIYILYCNLMFHYWNVIL